MQGTATLVATASARVEPPATTTAVAWMPNREMDLAEWSRVGQRMGLVGRCSQWWLGDWIRYGNAKFGEKYVRAAKITGYDAQTLMNMVYVASRFDFSRRRENLSWSHHETVASLEPGEQDRWLERAAALRLSILDLRTELRTARRLAGGRESREQLPQSAGASAPTVLCPNCGHEVPVPHTELGCSTHSSRRRDDRELPLLSAR